MTSFSNKAPSNIELIKMPSNESESSEGEMGISVSGVWTQEITDFVNAEGIKALYLNYTKGWNSEDLSFLSAVEEVENFKLISAKSSGLKSVEGLKSLKKISLSTTTKDKVDFSKLESLEDCFISWWKGAINIQKCKNLKRLYIDKCKMSDYSALSELKELEELTIGNSTVEDLSWLPRLTKLKKLELLNCIKIEDFSYIGQCSALNWLAIDGSKLLKNINFIANLRNLEILNISNNGTVESVAPIRNIPTIKAVAFGGNTVIEDGDLSIFESLNNLSMLMFSPKQHYSHKLIKGWNWKNFNNPDTLLQKK